MNKILRINLALGLSAKKKKYFFLNPKNIPPKNVATKLDCWGALKKDFYFFVVSLTVTVIHCYLPISLDLFLPLPLSS